MAEDTFDRLSQGRITDRPVPPFPKAPKELQQRPDYERGHAQWNSEIEQWRKSLDDRFAEVKRLEARIDELNADSTSDDVEGLRSEVNTLAASINSAIAELDKRITDIGAVTGVSLTQVLARTLGS